MMRNISSHLMTAFASQNDFITYDLSSITVIECNIYVSIFSSFVHCIYQPFIELLHSHGAVWIVLLLLLYFLFCVIFDFLTNSNYSCCTFGLSSRCINIILTRAHIFHMGNLLILLYPSEVSLLDLMDARLLESSSHSISDTS